ncbi:MAG TPA: hypothetical protein DDZ89_20580 [Clostridiales bacterium]|nr:hypothetical protein [Clostridiales bacterium]
MYFRYKPDFEESYPRYEAFFHGETLDRPLVSVKIPAKNQAYIPQKKVDSHRERWLDVEYRAKCDVIRIGNYEYPYDAMPVVFPNLGPEIFSACCGCPYHFGETTTWSEPVVQFWENDYDKCTLNTEHPLFKALERYTDCLLAYGKGNFIVGLTDFHPGADHLAALRDPANLCMDLLDDPEYVKKALVRSYNEYFYVYELFYNKIKQADMPVSSWLQGISKEKFYIPSCDFSYLISNDMFEEFFLPGIVKECRYYTHSIYHLDGISALRHLDSILQIKELGAVQWVPGAGHEGYAKWMDVYRRIQAKGKGIFLNIDLTELDLVFESLRPDGVWFNHISGIKNKEMLDDVVKRICKWK